jgi:hypothetical protein
MDFDPMLRRSLEAAKARKPLFEESFVYNGGFARADILNPVGQDAWDIIEVKSSTDAKPVNLLDLAFQAFVYNGAGLKIHCCWLMHVNRDYVRCRSPKLTHPCSLRLTHHPWHSRRRNPLTMHYLERKTTVRGWVSLSERRWVKLSDRHGMEERAGLLVLP